MLPPLVRSRAAHVVGGLAFGIQLAVGFLPTFAGPGYESALAAGLTLPLLAAVAGAISIARARPEPFDAFNRGVAIGAIAFVAGAVAILVHGVRAGFCDPAQGVAFVVLGPGVGCFLGGAWGAVAGELAGRTRRPTLLAILLAALGPAASVGASVVRFYTSPMVFAYDPFVGYFSGTLYDTIVDASGLVSYRAGSIATLFALFVLALHLARTPSGGVALQGIGRPGLAMLGGLAAVAAFLHVTAGPRMGHWQTRASIAEALGAVVTGDRCVVVHDRTIAAERVQRFARECEAHVGAIEAWLGAPGPRQITAFLFASEAQKGALMGASGTQIAKPWRAEIYLDEADFPHRSLGHEVAHVVAASIARGPFRVAGDLGGWLPDPGLIEGLAVAAAPRDDDLSSAEWARAMKELGLLPGLDRLFGLGFLAETSSRAYTASGAFVAWARERSGPEAIRRWYGGEPLERALGEPLAQLERAWHDDLDAIELPEAARVQARARFDRPPIFERRCPRTVDACRERAALLARAGDLVGARAELARARELDGNPQLAIEAALLEARAGQEDEARRALAGLAEDEGLGPHVRVRAAEELGDLALAAGDGEAALARYEQARRGVYDEGRLRTLEVKMHAARVPEVREAIVALLVGRGPRRPDRTWAAELLGRLDQERTQDGLAPYLLARWYVDAGVFEEAAPRLDRALERLIAVPRVRAEAARLRLVVACGLGQREAAERALALLAAEPEVRSARLEAARRFAARCGIAVPPRAAAAAPPADEDAAGAAGSAAAPPTEPPSAASSAAAAPPPPPPAPRRPPGGPATPRPSDGRHQPSSL